MPASRILEGSLPEQQPKGPDFFWRPTTTQNGARAGYQGQSPWLVSGNVWLLSAFQYDSLIFRESTEQVWERVGRFLQGFEPDADVVLVDGL